MADDGWEDVTDPNEIQKILGKKALGKMGVTVGGGGDRDPDKAFAARQLLKRANEAAAFYNRNLRGPTLADAVNSLPFGLGATPTTDQFDTIGNSMLPFAKKLLRSPGEGADSDKDTSVWANLLPSSKAYDKVNVARIHNLQRTAQDFLRQYGPPRAPAPAAQTGERFQIVGRRPAK